MPFSDKDVREVQPQLPFLSRLSTIGQTCGMVGLTRSIYSLRGWYRYFLPTSFEPNTTKTYRIRSYLPVRIFVPATYSAESSTEKLQTLFTIHGGGFTIGCVEDDDKWNRTFADTHKVLTIALNYSKAPFYPFPTAIYDLEALILAILDDPSLPMDKTKCAIAGFSAGGNLALAATQLDGIKTAFKQHGSDGFSAVVPLYPGLDRTITRDFKVTQRQFKPDLTPNRNSLTDFLLRAGKAFEWSYIPVRHDLRDPLLSPIFAVRENLPSHIFMVACELDLSSHEAWRMACRLAGRPEPAMDEKSGRKEIGKTGDLELADERFSWEVRERGVRWLLVPDVVHGFDHLGPLLLGDKTSVYDAEMKNAKLNHEIGDWLKTRVWAQ